jgi:TatD DNase family protein
MKENQTPSKPKSPPQNPDFPNLPNLNNDWIDAHCHLADPKYTETDLETIIQRSQKARVGRWIQGGICPEDWDRQLILQKKYGRSIITCFGLHPWWVAERQGSQQARGEIEEALKTLETRISEACALGELGLDFHPRFQNPNSQEIQRFAFERQLEIAKNNQKPLVLHIVRAHAEALEILKKWSPYPSSGIIHSFSGSLEIAKEYLELGFSISIGGSITKQGFQKLKKAINYLPQDKIVIETDSPDQTPELADVRSDQLNEPANLVGIAMSVAQWCQSDYKEILNTSTDNLKRIFGI